MNELLRHLILNVTVYSLISCFLLSQNSCGVQPFHRVLEFCFSTELLVEELCESERVINQVCLF